jgi:hypothetical protein
VLVTAESWRLEALLHGCAFRDRLPATQQSINCSAFHAAADAKRFNSKQAKGQADCKSGGSTPKHSRPASNSKLPVNSSAAAASQQGTTSSSSSSSRPAQHLREQWTNMHDAVQTRSLDGRPYLQMQPRLIPLAAQGQVCGDCAGIGSHNMCCSSHPCQLAVICNILQAAVLSVLGGSQLR